MRLMEERIARPEKYIDDGKPTPSEFEGPKLYHYAIFSDNVLAASVVVNSAVKNSKDPSQHVFHVVTDKMNLGAMQVMFKMKDYSGVYPKLHRILFLDDDIVVQRDLTGLWKIDMDGKVNGAVETCFGSFHQYTQYMNFSHPLINKKFNPKACAWAYGMNFFDLDAWRREKSTEEYHYWQSTNENRGNWEHCLQV
ncbi:hypothetical protein K7X08_022584 [Anisodus acutangulus]|uniref:Hexosyltransferase n=1 Tax=Anisodus acutangulus TaxID=402998 RepID=A0A9Q1MLV1_9SOLA|nr:hypothetical protein K7X08_022584 [Anisodus acutangulus]